MHMFLSMSFLCICSRHHNSPKARNSSRGPSAKSEHSIPRLSLSVFLTDCAVCANNYAAGFSYTCRSCRGNNKAIAVGTFCISLVVVMALVLVAIIDLLQDVQEPGRVGSSRCGISRWSAIGRISESLPLTAIKIVVVVWQIVTQVSVREDGQCLACQGRGHDFGGVRG